MGGGGYCFAHDPAKVAERDEARRKGGANSATRQRLDRLVPATLRPMIADLITAVTTPPDESGGFSDQQDHGPA